MKKIDLSSPDLYFNRELSWLKFNSRVLAQAQDVVLPPLERLKFIAIYGTNLDEFYMIRVAGLKSLFKARNSGDWHRLRLGTNKKGRPGLGRGYSH